MIGFTLVNLVRYLMTGVCVFGLVDAALRPAPNFPAYGKLTKPAWCGILAVAALAAFYGGPLSLLGPVAAVAGIVYLVDVRPAVSGGKNPWD